MDSKSIKMSFLHHFSRLDPLTAKICDFAQIYSTLHCFMYETQMNYIYILSNKEIKSFKYMSSKSPFQNIKNAPKIIVFGQEMIEKSMDEVLICMGYLKIHLNYFIIFINSK
jgi:hypothetical protein